MTRATALVLACLGAALVLLPLGIHKPGLPMQVREWEPTWYLAAASLAHDGDLACGPEDLRRFFAEFPFAHEPELELSSPDGGETLYFATPLPYALLAAPWAGLFGAEGPLALNLLLLWAAIALLATAWARENPAPLALTFATGAMLASAAFAWAFAVGPEVFVLAAAAAALVLIRPRELAEPPATRLAAASGALLAAAAIHQPVLAFLALVPLGGWLTARGDTPRLARLRPVLAWLTGATATIALVAGLAWLATGSFDLDPRTEARVVVFENPHAALDELFRQAPGPGVEAEPSAPLQGSSERWLDRAGILLLGRHVGLIPYFPWVLPALLFFLLDARHSRRGFWLAGASAAILAALWLAIPFDRQAGGDAIGHRALIGLYPALLLLAGELRWRWPVLAGWALGGTLLGALLFTPFGAPIPESTWQAHTRNPPLSALPLELGLLPELPDYRAWDLSDELRLWARRDQVEERNQGLVVRGGEKVELWLESPRELGSAMVLELASPAVPNQVEVEFAGTRESFQVESGENEAGEDTPRRLSLNPGKSAVKRWRGGRELFFYRLEIETERGERPGWRGPEKGRGPYVGAQFQILGTEEKLGRDLYQLEWLGCGAPREVEVGEEFLALARLRNTSAHPWPIEGPVKVRLGYRWLDEEGKPVRHRSARTDLENQVSSGETLETWQKIIAPGEPGSYALELDAIYEKAAWFSSRGAETCKTSITVRPEKPPIDD